MEFYKILIVYAVCAECSMSLEVARQTQLGRVPRFSLGRSCLLTFHLAGGLRHVADLSRLPPSVFASRCDAYPLRAA